MLRISLVIVYKFQLNRNILKIWPLPLYDNDIESIKNMFNISRRS